MSAKEDAEKVGIEILGRLGTNSVTVIAAWAYAVLDIIAGLRPQMTAPQFALTVQIFERWGMAIPHMMHAGPPRTWLRSEIPELKKYFEDTLKTISRVRDARASLPSAAENADRDELLIKDADEFCTGTLKEMDRLFSMGDIYCESFVFSNLILYCKDLMLVVMGDKLHDQFKEEYISAMKALRSAEAMVNAPKV